MEKAINGPYISNDMIACDSVEEFLEPFKNTIDSEFNGDMHLDFDIYHKSLNRKFSPILTLARPKDAKEIVKIYDDIYFGNYPYIEMLDVNEVSEMINIINKLHLEYLITGKTNVSVIAIKKDDNNFKLIIDYNKCINCYYCLSACQNNAIKTKSTFKNKSIRLMRLILNI